MMGAMGHPPRHARRAAQAGARVGASIAVAALVAGCSTGSPADDDRTQEAQSAALRVRTVSGAERLDEQTRSQIERAVGDALSDYVVEAFLGTFPRQQFVQSFESFTSGVAPEAAQDIEVLTAASAGDATGVRATRLDARLSFLSRAGTVYSGSAKVDFSFEATMEDGTTRPLVLAGRIMLDAGAEGAADDIWSIFGYDVTLEDGLTTEVEE